MQDGGRGRARDPDGQVSSSRLHSDRTTTRDLGAARHYTVSAARGWWVTAAELSGQRKVLFVQNMVTVAGDTVHGKFTADSNLLRSQPGEALGQEGTASVNFSYTPWENRLVPPAKQSRGQSPFTRGDKPSMPGINLQALIPPNTTASKAPPAWIPCPG